jgi:hypothetical protein
VYQFDILWQELVDAVLDDRMCLPAANLHDHPRLRNDVPNFIEHLVHDVRIAIFIEIFHFWSPSGLNFSQAGRPESSEHQEPRITQRIMAKKILEFLKVKSTFLFSVYSP